MINKKKKTEKSSLEALKFCIFFMNFIETKEKNTKVLKPMNLDL